MLYLKIEIILIIISYETFYLYLADNDVLWSFFQLQNKWITRNLKEGGYGALNTDTNTSMLQLKSKICFIINSPMIFYLYLVDNDVLWSFFQIQNNWRPRKLKKGRYEAMNLDTNTSMLSLKIKIDLFILIRPWFFIFILKIMMFCEISFNFKTNGELEI